MYETSETFAHFYFIFFSQINPGTVESLGTVTFPHIAGTLEPFVHIDVTQELLMTS